jgi:hypothetical protein
MRQNSDNTTFYVSPEFAYCLEAIITSNLQVIIYQGITSDLQRIASNDHKPRASQA